MAFADWSDEEYDEFHDKAFLDVFNHIRLEGYSDSDMALAEEFFEQGWTNFNISKELRDEFQNAFFDLTGYSYQDLDDPRMMDTGGSFWESFREAYDSVDLG